ncbi:hypothetical protein TNCV_3955601 [Trichonephila clavipes]|nr:hypothetical protein TNCV_3955601 [Trichonephila clavipes]
MASGNSLPRFNLSVQGGTQGGSHMLMLFQISLEQESQREVHLTFPHKNVTQIGYRSPNKYPREKPNSPGKEQGQVKKTLIPYKGHTTQVTVSKARQGHLKSPGSSAL